MTNAEKTQLGRIEDALYGNGKEGLLVRVARIETAQTDAKDAAMKAQISAERSVDSVELLSSKALQAVNNLVVKQTEMNALVKMHIETEHLSGLIKKKEFWVLIVIGFVVLHTIVTYLPGGWDWLIALLGLPQLHIPIL